MEHDRHARDPSTQYEIEVPPELIHMQQIDAPVAEPPGLLQDAGRRA